MCDSNVRISLIADQIITEENSQGNAIINWDNRLHNRKTLTRKEKRNEKSTIGCEES